MTTSPTFDPGTGTIAAGVVRPSWMSDEMYQTWLTLYLDAGGDAVTNAAQVATAQFREDPRYGTTWFPGIKTEDGTIRYAESPEETYASNMRAFRNTVEDANMRPDLFAEEYIDLIEGDVSPNEFASRVNALSDRVLIQGPGIRNWYAENYGINMTSEGILAGLMSSNINDAILNRQITMAEIGGEAVTRGFDIAAEFAELLATEGQMDRAAAQRLFGTAENVLPIMSALARRHGDPDDEFDIEEFAAGAVLDDPTQIQRLGRLQAQEAAQFTGGAQVEFERSNAFGVTGLAET